MRLTTHVMTTMILALVRVMNDLALKGYKITMNLEGEINHEVNHSGLLLLHYHRAIIAIPCLLSEHFAQWLYFKH